MTDRIVDMRNMDVHSAQAVWIIFEIVGCAAGRSEANFRLIANTRLVAAGRSTGAGRSVRRVWSIRGPVVHHVVDFTLAAECEEDESALQSVEEDERVPKDGHFGQGRSESKNPAQPHD